MLKNPNKIMLIPGMFYLLNSEISGLSRYHAYVEEYTDDVENTESRLFGPESNCTVLSAMGVIEYDTRT